MSISWASRFKYLVSTCILAVLLFKAVPLFACEIQESGYCTPDINLCACGNCGGNFLRGEPVDDVCNPGDEGSYVQCFETPLVPKTVRCSVTGTCYTTSSPCTGGGYLCLDDTGNGLPQYRAPTKTQDPCDS